MRESVLRETHAVLARLRERHRLRSVFGGIVQRLACAAVAVSVEAATARRSRKRGAEEALAAGEAGQRRSVRQRSGHTGTSAGATFRATQLSTDQLSFYDTHIHISTDKLGYRK